MEKKLQAVYKDGVLQPLEAVQLEERQQVTVTITEPTTAGQDIAGYFTPKNGQKRLMTTSRWMK